MLPPSASFCGTVRNRAAALMVATVAVALVFTILALLNLELGGTPRGLTSGIGAVLFAFLLFPLRTKMRRVPPARPATAGTVGPGPSAALVVVAAVMWAMAGLFWYFAAVGTTARFGIDPVLFAVPLSIYPIVVLWARRPQNPPASVRPEEHAP